MGIIRKEVSVSSLRQFLLVGKGGDYQKHRKGGERREKSSGCPSMWNVLRQIEYKLFKNWSKAMKEVCHFQHTS
jgi:hypothetical protein